MWDCAVLDTHRQREGGATRGNDSKDNAVSDNGKMGTSGNNSKDDAPIDNTWHGRTGGRDQSGKSSLNLFLNAVALTSSLTKGSRSKQIQRQHFSRRCSKSAIISCGQNQRPLKDHVDPAFLGKRFAIPLPQSFHRQLL